MLKSQTDSLARSTAAPNTTWRQQLREAFREPATLLDYLGLPADRADQPRPVPFPMMVPLAFARRMRRNDRHDPLLRQVLPDPDETRLAAGFSSDPVGDLGSRRAPGLLHKYTGRVLVVTTGACAIHCRYCFRQHFPYPGERAPGRRWSETLDYLAGNADVNEIILSGGDPLMLPTRQLRALTDSLGTHSGIKRLRLHTRLPVVLPDRVNAALLEWMDSLPWPLILVVHANHPAEFDAEVDTAMQRLRSSGAQLLNQAVLLAGVNDDVAVLKALMERGLSAGVLPYYLHLLDRVAGAQRFEVELQKARQLLEELRRELPGYLVPRLVLEQAGMPYKTPVL